MRTQGLWRVLMIAFTSEDIFKISKWHKYLIPIFKFELDLRVIFIILILAI